MAGMQVGGYANGFQTTTSEWMAREAGGGEEAGRGGARLTRPEDYDAEGYITPEAYLEHCKRWVGLGATVVGGCCGVRPTHVRALSEAFAGRS